MKKPLKFSYRATKLIERYQQDAQAATKNDGITIKPDNNYNPNIKVGKAVYSFDGLFRQVQNDQFRFSSVGKNSYKTPKKTNLRKKLSQIVKGEEVISEITHNQTEVKDRQNFNTIYTEFSLSRLSPMGASKSKFELTKSQFDANKFSNVSIRNSIREKRLSNPK